MIMSSSFFTDVDTADTTSPPSRPPRNRSSKKKASSNLDGSISAQISDLVESNKKLTKKNSLMKKKLPWNSSKDGDGDVLLAAQVCDR